MVPTRLVVGISLSLWIAAVALAAQQVPDAASQRRSIWQGVFTSEQAQRGSASFTTSCVRCHALDPQGVPFRMSGDAFWNNWADDALDVLYTRVRDNMPANAPNSLDPQVYADIVAFILSVNGVPAGGDAELTPGAVSGIQMVRREGPQPVPAGALVAVAGCLTQSGRLWFVESASEPLRSRSRDISVDMGQADRLAPAGKSYELKFPLIPLTSMIGQQVLARGLLLRDPDAINVESVRSLGRPCAG